jgi:hypothetical protein
MTTMRHGMVRSNAAAALLCGSIHAHFAAVDAVPHAVNTLILNKIYCMIII